MVSAEDSGLKVIVLLINVFAKGGGRILDRNAFGGLKFESGGTVVLLVEKSGDQGVGRFSFEGGRLADQRLREGKTTTAFPKGRGWIGTVIGECVFESGFCWLKWVVKS
jgi:hypothetical protein